MLNVYVGEEGLFEKGMSGESACIMGEMECSNSEYGVWLRELKSVRERREDFLCKMGFLESRKMELERATESSGAVSSSNLSSSDGVDDNSLFEREESKSEANCLDDYSDQDWLDDLCIDVEQEFRENLEAGGQVQQEQVENPSAGKETKKSMRWWRHLVQRMKRNQVDKRSKPSKWSRNQIRMEQSGKRCLECSAVYSGQEINAHNGLIWTMKFSPDGQYLASGGEDGLVCVWRVTSMDVASASEKCRFGCQDEFKSTLLKKPKHPTIIIPEKAFHIDEKPMHVFRGHGGDVLDLAWSKSNYLLSSSMDRTVQLWRVGSEKCLGVFDHSNYVTCVQFNPVNENYFISGSIDGKVRIWGVHGGRVKDWVNAHDIVTAVSYQPNGKGFVVGSICGMCRFYEAVDDELLLTAEQSFHGKKRLAGNKITSIQFSKNDSQRLMIASEDSKIRILDGHEVVSKYKGSKKSGTQTSASFTSDGNHIVSVGEDSNIFVWNYDDPRIPTFRQAKYKSSCERLSCDGVSVALTWSDFVMEGSRSSSHSSVPTPDSQASTRVFDSDRFSLANWFSMDGSLKGSMTWPEERLPWWDSPCSEHECQPCKDHGDHHLHQQARGKFENSGSMITSPTWGLVFVTGNCDGTIRTFHNYGLPVRT